MVILFVLMGLVFLISGGVGLFYVNTAERIATGTPLFFLGNLGSATFLVIGALILFFIAFFNREFD
jgi:hypothetical protein